MIKISKREKDYLVDNGCKWGEEIHRTYSDGKTYYATENRKILSMLEKYRKSIVLESH